MTQYHRLTSFNRCDHLSVILFFALHNVWVKRKNIQILIDYEPDMNLHQSHFMNTLDSLRVIKS